MLIELLVEILVVVVVKTDVKVTVTVTRLAAGAGWMTAPPAPSISGKPPTRPPWAAEELNRARSSRMGMRGFNEDFILLRCVEMRRKEGGQSADGIERPNGRHRFEALLKFMYLQETAEVSQSFTVVKLTIQFRKTGKDLVPQNEVC